MSSSTLRPELVENYGWIGAELLDVPMSTSQPASESHLPVSPDEIKALYGEVFEALQVPRRLSGPRRVRRGPFEIASEIFPVGYFSGDLVSVFDAGDATFLAIGDIAGKGLTAAMWSTHVLGLIRTYCTSLRSPEAALKAINRDLYVLGSVPLTTMVL